MEIHHLVKMANQIGDFLIHINLLGGDRVIRHRLQNAMDVHEALIHGLPGAALIHLVGSLVVRHDSTLLEKAVGMSVRTIQRRKGSPSKPLSQEQSGRTWKFAEILATGRPREAATSWMARLIRVT